MTLLFVSLHVLAALILIGLIMMHRGEGADMGVSFGGGGAQTLFGSRGSGSFIGKLTGAVAGVFMLTSLTLAFFSQKQAESVVDKAAVQQPVQQKSLPPANSNQGNFNPSKLKDKKKTDSLPAAN